MFEKLKKLTAVAPTLKQLKVLVGGVEDLQPVSMQVELVKKSVKIIGKLVAMYVKRSDSQKDNQSLTAISVCLREVATNMIALAGVIDTELDAPKG